MNYICRESAAFALTLAVFLSTGTSAFAQGTDRQREACTPDVFRLCGAYIPDADRIAACLRASGPRLSKPCYDVFFPQPDPQPQQFMPPRRRYDGTPPPYYAPPPRNDDDD
jgi:hypothetical protein